MPDTPNGSEASPYGEGRRRRRLLWVLVFLAGLLGAGVYSYNQYMRTHQPLHVINARPDPVEVVIDDAPALTVAAGQHTLVTVAEGRHRATVIRQDGTQGTVEFELSNTWRERFASENVFVLNIDGAAVLAWREVYYSEKPDPNLPDKIEFHFGVPFQVFRNVDFPFQEFPEQLQLKKDPEKRTGLAVVPLSPFQTAVVLARQAGFGKLFRFAELWLTITPDDENLIRLYQVYSAIGNSLDRCRRFLAQGLDRRPVIIEWHRAYQQVCRHTGHDEGLAEQYTAMLERSPDDSALLYLVGRLLSDPEKALDHFDRSILADPQNPYPYYAKGYALALRGDFAAAKPLCQRACELKAGYPLMANFLLDIRMALREYAGLEKELRQIQQENPFDIENQRQLLQVLVLSGRVDEARKAHEEFVESIKTNLPEEADHLRLQSLMALQYLTEDWEGYLETARALRGPLAGPGDEMNALLELGRPAEVEKLLEENPAFEDWRIDLLLSLAWRGAGDVAKAESWRDRAAQALDAGGPDQRRAAALLRGKPPVDLRALDGLFTLRRSQKAVLTVVLAAQDPENRGPLLELAQKLNVPGLFPYRFLQRAIDQLRS